MPVLTIFIVQISPTDMSIPVMARGVEGSHMRGRQIGKNGQELQMGIDCKIANGEKLLIAQWGKLPVLIVFLGQISPTDMIIPVTAGGVMTRCKIWAQKLPIMIMV